MAFQSVPNVFELDVNMNYQGTPIQNTFYYRVATADYTLASATALATALSVYWAATYVDFLGVDTVLENVTARGLQNANDFQVVYTGNALAAGVMLNTNPNNVAFAFQRLSGLTGRSARGRIFWPVPSAARNTAADNFVLGSWADDCSDALQLSQSAMAAAVASAQEVIVSRYAEGALRPVGVTFDVSLWTYSDLRIDTMKGRLP